MASRQLCTFFLERFYFGVYVDIVQEVIRYQKLTSIPLAPGNVKGLINLRGQIVTALDLRTCLDLPERDKEQLPMNVVVNGEDGAFSLLVDQISDVLELSDDLIEKPPETLEGSARDYILGAYQLNDNLLLALDTSKLLRFSSKL